MQEDIDLKKQLEARLIIRLAFWKYQMTHGEKPIYSKELLKSYVRVIKDVEKSIKDDGG